MGEETLLWNILVMKRSHKERAAFVSRGKWQAMCYTSKLPIP